jgi:hypothetical protein
MQLEHYDRREVHWSETISDVVIKLFDDNNNWSGYKNLFNNITSSGQATQTLIGCFLTYKYDSYLS